MTSSKINYLSLGENCLPDDILKRYGLKSFSTPYSPARSNIEYAIYNETHNYKNLLKKENLIIENRYGKNTAVNLSFPCVSHIYDPSVKRGFEFTHHNVICEESARESYIRKIDRMRSLKESYNIFLYNYRINEDFNLYTLIQKCNQFLEFYQHSHLCVMTQTLCTGKNERSIRIYHKGNITLFRYYTMQKWEGADSNIFWARCDDDLIKIMINYMKELSKEIK